MSQPARAPRGNARYFGLALVALVVVPYLACEGLFVLISGSSPTTSLAHRVISSLVRPAPAPYDAHNPYTWMVTDDRELNRQVDAMKAGGVGMGNSPFKVLKNDEIAINTEVDGCLWQKPRVRKRMSFLRSNLYNPFDQTTYFHDADAELDPELAAFFERYGFREVTLTTNDAGERITVPDVEADDVVLVAGDSIANGAMLDDAETLSSALQQRDRSRRYVNLGVSRAKAADIVCNLDRAAERYAGRIRQVVYVFCENDYDASRPFGTPSELIAWLAEFRERAGVDEILLLYIPYIYNSVPEVTRVKGQQHHDWPPFIEEKRELLELARDAGFRVIDFLDVANQVREEDRTQFAPLRLYVDHSHLSPVGVAHAVRLIGD